MQYSLKTIRARKETAASRVRKAIQEEMGMMTTVEERRKRKKKSQSLK